MLSMFSGFLDGIPAFWKSVILLALGFLFIRAGWHGGALQAHVWGAAK